MTTTAVTGASINRTFELEPGDRHEIGDAGVGHRVEAVAEAPAQDSGRRDHEGHLRATEADPVNSGQALEPVHDRPDDDGESQADADLQVDVQELDGRKEEVLDG
jgi:hypothetical protein